MRPWFVAANSEMGSGCDHGISRDPRNEMVDTAVARRQAKRMHIGTEAALYNSIARRNGLIRLRVWRDLAEARRQGAERRPEKVWRDCPK
jgi:hypothetical protein